MAIVNCQVSTTLPFKLNTVDQIIFNIKANTAPKFEQNLACPQQIQNIYTRRNE